MSWHAGDRRMLLALAVVWWPAGDGAAERQALAEAVARAEAGAIDDATQAFAELRRSDDRAIASAAAYDFARVRFERSVRRSLPPSPGKREKPAAIADARAVLLRMREELEEARDALLEAERGGAVDRERLASLAAVANRLRAVVDRDRQWQTAAEAAAARAGANGPLKPGSAAARAAAGAPGKRGGASSGESDGVTPPPTSALPAPVAGSGMAAPDEVRARLEQVRADAQEQERRRADAARRREPVPRQ